MLNQLSLKIKIIRAWKKAIEVEGYDPNVWRKDFAGAWIRFDSFGSRTEYGWGIDYMCPLSKGGTNTEENIIAMHWQNNLKKGSDYPIFYTSISSEGDRNINVIKKWEIRSRL
jgi:hypothetical protein